MPEALCYETAKAVTTHPAIIVWLVVMMSLSFILYIIIGALSRGKSPSGKVYSQPMIMSKNWWWTILIFTIQIVFIILLIFPVWLKIFC